MFNNKKKDPIFNHRSLSNLDLGATDQVLRTTHCLMKVNISVKSFQNPPRNGKVMDQTGKKTIFLNLICVTLTLELQTWVLRVMHRLMMLTPYDGQYFC